MNTLRKGNTGDAVCYLQTLLNRAQQMTVDGVFGPKTDAAVKAFQQANNLVVDGIVGIKTWTVLNNLALQTTWPVYNGKFLSEADLIAAAETLGVELAVIKAVTEVEAHGAGFIPGTTKPKILFEGHVFWRRLKAWGLDPEPSAKGNEDILHKSWTKQYYLGGLREYDRLHKATAIHGRPAAYESCSWGMFQIMGFHWEALGYQSIDAFVDFMYVSEAEHLKAFLRYIQVNDLAKHLKAKNWTEFARLYNGPGYAENQYDTKMAAAYARYKKLHRTHVREGR